MKYRKKPVVIEARHHTSETFMDVYQWVEANTQGSFDVNDPAGVVPASGVSIDAATGLMVIATLEGLMTVQLGDYVIQGTQGEFYPCKPAAFADTFEFAPEGATAEDEDEPEDHRRSIQCAVQAIVDERNPDEHVYVTGWVLAYESASTTGLNEGYYGGGNITVAQQSPAMSRGLALGCADFYNPTNWGANPAEGDES